MLAYSYTPAARCAKRWLDVYNRIFVWFIIMIKETMVCTNRWDKHYEINARILSYGDFQTPIIFYLNSQYVPACFRL